MQVAQLKKAFITQAHADNKHITLAIFVKELDDDIEVANWIAQQFGADYTPAIQMHMRNMIDARLKLNAGQDAVIKHLLENVAEAMGITATELEDKIKAPAQDVGTQAKQATDALLSKLRLH